MQRSLQIPSTKGADRAGGRGGGLLLELKAKVKDIHENYPFRCRGDTYWTQTKGSNSKSKFPVRSLNLGMVVGGRHFCGIWTPSPWQASLLVEVRFHTQIQNSLHPTPHLYSGVVSRMSCSSSELSITDVTVIWRCKMLETQYGE